MADSHADMLQGTQGTLDLPLLESLGPVRRWRMSQRIQQLRNDVASMIPSETEP